MTSAEWILCGTAAGSLLGLLHTYLFFPALLARKARNIRLPKDVYPPDMPEEWPGVSILLAVYNEEAVLEQKLNSTLNTGYPLHKLEFLIGNDASTDKSAEILRKWEQRFPEIIRVVPFAGRTGKSGIINALAAQARHPILVLTDANVFFIHSTIYELAAHFKRPQVGIVGGNIINRRIKKDGISIQEKTYLSRENMIKFQEGALYGCMIGAFGGCYAVRAAAYAPVPPRFFMDDFYITMHALREGWQSINNPQARCFEDVSNKTSEEYRRKVRISIGNWQNLVCFRGMLRRPFSPLARCFFSHKVLRWLGPFFLLLLLGAALGLLISHPFNVIYLVLTLSILGIWLAPVLDWFLRRALGVHWAPVRFASHFITMNVALLHGFVRYLGGVKSNIWKPTQRFQ